VHVAIVGGAGALGSVYGARLANEAGVHVSLVVRASKPAHHGAIRLEGVDSGDVLEWTAPEYVAEVPSSSDVVLVCVRQDQLDTALVQLLQAGPGVPAVFLTPMLPDDYVAMRTSLGPRVVAAMPSVVAYRNEAGAVRYWLPRVAATLLEADAPLPALETLIAALTRAGVSARFEHGVHERNPATTILFAPLAMALDIAGSIEALLGHAPLLSLALDAASEARELVKHVGKPAPWSTTLARFVRPLTLKVGIGLARARSPEAVQYVERHFGRKLHAQNLRMAEGIVTLAARFGVSARALGALTEGLRMSGASISPPR
jgi:hypothetical protein